MLSLLIVLLFALSINYSTLAYVNLGGIVTDLYSATSKIKERPHTTKFIHFGTELKGTHLLHSTMIPLTQLVHLFLTCYPHE